MYENVKKTSIYVSKLDGRSRIQLTFNDGTRKQMSYPKYLMECHLNRYLTDDETVDHIDQNVQNNEISNLRVINRREHVSNDIVRNKDVEVECAYCGKKFIIPGNKLQNRNRKDRHSSGYFCSRECAGRYGAEVQHHKREPNKPTPRIIPEKYTKHNFNK